MPVYEIEQHELYTQKYCVEAESEAHAIQRLFADEADPIAGSLTFIEPDQDRGLPVDEFQELAESLGRLSEELDDDIIPAVRSVRLVDE